MGRLRRFARAKVYVNDAEQSFSDGDVPAFITHGTTVLPLRTLADSLQALVRWDNKNMTVSLYKPNVHMFVVKDLIKQDGGYTMKYPFGGVTRGDKLDFVVFAQIDNLKTNVSSFKISIKTPSGNDAVDPIEQPVTQSRRKHLAAVAI
ncbi:stalk domain-containing protein [Gordoniibacillus kamchatkensis]|uniref:stalk domain-containing protein n=1 Tax=Gordoniibacillus kamchatkensis TaxID=1590651 RepID=UPI001E4211C8|nr:stalk domain-containing protein [Paenibacillus sp. VKM B-2647]